MHWQSLARRCRYGSTRHLMNSARQRRLPSEAYKDLVDKGQLRYDVSQWRVVRKYFDKLHGQLDGYVLPSLQPSEPGRDDDQASERELKPIMVPRGVYVYGQVGTGKSMLMDMFYNHVAVSSKRRVHFNKFMLEVHQRLQVVKKKHLDLYGRQRNIVLDSSRDAISIVAEELVHENHLLCFDEFQVTDIADAMIMRKLFSVFFSSGGVMVATSNTAPHNLYKDGTNREYFMPFLDQLAAHSKIVDMASLIDHRTLEAPSSKRSFFYPLSPATTQRLNTIVDEIAGGALFQPVSVSVMMGRQLCISATSGGVASATFDELCNTEKGAADYKALCEHFHTLVLRDVPRLEMKAHDQARRFILLVDELYEHHCQLICSADSDPISMFNFDDAPLAGHAEAAAAYQALKKHDVEENSKQGIPSESSWDAPVGAHHPAKPTGLDVSNLCSLQDLKVAFKRTVSRLTEMQSEKYYTSSRRRDRV